MDVSALTEDLDVGLAVRKRRQNAELDLAIVQREDLVFVVGVIEGFADLLGLFVSGADVLEVGA